MSQADKLITKNRKARYDYEILDTLEAGIRLLGTEVKSLREGNVNLRDAFCSVDNGEMYLYNCHIAPYQQAGEHFNHNPRRDRKLLLHKREILRWEREAEDPGLTIVPLKLYFHNGYAKAQIGLARGKKQHDKRSDIKEREAKRRMQQAKHRHR